jgi:hypothetical protein
MIKRIPQDTTTRERHMYKLAPVLILTAVAGVSLPVPVVAAPRLMAPLSGPSAVPQAALVLVGGMHGGGMGGMIGGGMGGMTGGGMGGTTAGGMGGMTVGGMGGTTGGGMGGMTGGGMSGITGGSMGGMAGGGMPAYGGAAGYGGTSADGYQGNGGSYASGEGRQQYYQCIAPHGQCSVTSSPGSLRHGASCTCLVAGQGKIK